MISARSSMTRGILAGRSMPNAGASFLQANLPFASPSFDDNETKKTNNSPSVRHFLSPAYKRHMKKQNFQKSDIQGLLESNIKGLKPSVGAHEPGIQKPTIEVAKDMGKAFSEMENDTLLVIAENGSHTARCEVLKRHIMAVDEVEYDVAEKKLEEITETSKKSLFLYTLPYRIGYICAIVAGIGAVPMVFEINTAMAFNKDFVTMDIPVKSDLDTVLETGAWTWNWMEPLTGTLSFSLLAFQYARQQFLNLGIKPFTQRVIHRRSNYLIKVYPQYSDRLLTNFVETYPMSDGN